MPEEVHDFTLDEAIAQVVIETGPDYLTLRVPGQNHAFLLIEATHDEEGRYILEQIDINPGTGETVDRDVLTDMEHPDRGITRQ